jgi:hypothetical protein
MTFFGGKMSIYFPKISKFCKKKSKKIHRHDQKMEKEPTKTTEKSTTQVTTTEGDQNITTDVNTPENQKIENTEKLAEELDEDLDDALLDEVIGDMDEKLNLTAGERSVGGEYSLALNIKISHFFSDYFEILTKSRQRTRPRNGQTVRRLHGQDLERP